MKRTFYPLICLLFSLLIFSIIWLWPSNPSQIKRISQSGDANYAKDIRLSGYINDPGTGNEDMMMEFKAYQDQGLILHETLNQYQPNMSAREEVLSLFPLWNRPNRLGNLKLVDNQSHSLWLNNIQFSNDGWLNYTLINKKPLSYKNMSYYLKSWSPKMGYFHSLSYSLTDEGLKLLLGLYNSQATEEEDYFNGFVLLTLDPKTGQVKDEVKQEGKVYFDYFPNLGLDTSYQPAYHIVQPYLNSSAESQQYNTLNEIWKGAPVQVYDPDFNLLAEINGHDYQTDVFLIWAKKDRIYFLTGNGLSYSGPSSLVRMGQDAKLSLYEYDIDKQASHKITDLAEEIESLQIFQGNIHYVTSPSQGQTDQKNHLVLDPDLNQIVYQATWQAVHPDHKIQLSSLEPKS